MELTATNRSQAYPNAEKGGWKQTGTERSTEVVRAVDGCTDTFAEQRYRENEVFEISAFRSKVGLKKFKKDLQLSDEYSMILYVVLKAHAFSWPSGSVG